MTTEIENTPQKHEIVVANELNKVITGSWTAKEQDLFIVAMTKFQYSNEDTIVISLSELKGLGNFTRHNTKEFYRAITSFSSKLGQTYMYHEDTEEIVIQMIFEKFTFSKREGYLEITATSFLQNALKNVEKGFFRMTLEESVYLKSKYSKILYRLLRQWRHVGVYTAKSKELMRLLGTPEKYNMDLFRRKILTPAIQELGDNFKGLELHIIRASDQGLSMRGNPILKFKFMFEKTKRVNNKKHIKNTPEEQAIKRFKGSIKRARKAGVAVAKGIDMRKVK